MKRVLPRAARAAWLAIVVPVAGVLVLPSPRAVGAMAGDASPAALGSSLPANEVASDGSEQVSIPTRDNLTLAGAYYAPKKKGRVPAVLLVHDAGGSRAQLSPIAERLYKLGFAVLAIDLRGHGASATEQVNWSTMDGDARDRMWALTPRDLSAAADFLRKRSEVHTSNLSLVGLRAGAAVAVHYASGDQNARAVVLVDPSPETRGFNLPQDLAKLEGLPTLILAPTESRGIADRLASVGHAANGGLEYISRAFVKGGSENLLDDKSLPREVAEWLRLQVLPGKGER